MWLPIMSEHRGRSARLVHGGRYICRRLAGEDSTFDVVNTRSKGWCAVVVQARYAISLWQRPGSGQAHVWKSGSSNLWQAHSNERKGAATMPRIGVFAVSSRRSELATKRRRAVMIDECVATSRPERERSASPRGEQSPRRKQVSRDPEQEDRACSNNRLTAGWRCWRRVGVGAGAVIVVTKTRGTKLRGLRTQELRPAGATSIPRMSKRSYAGAPNLPHLPTEDSPVVAAFAIATTTHSFVSRLGILYRLLCRQTNTVRGFFSSIVSSHAAIVPRIARPAPSSLHDATARAAVNINAPPSPTFPAALPASAPVVAATMAVTAHGAAASPTSLSRTETLTLLSLSAASAAIIANTFHGDGEPLIASLALSILAFCLCFAMIRWLGPTFMKAGFRGRDLSKLNKIEIPECMGAVCAAVYLLTVIIFIPFPFYKDIVAATSGGGNRDVVVEVQEVNQGRFLHRFPHNKLASYLGAIIALQTIAFLGIGDDLFDIRWRHKWWIPGLASIPILVVYFVDFGVTSIVIPVQLQPYLGELFDLGALYYVYMACVAMFCPQSINMLAGINGIEVSQCVVVAILIAFNDCLYLLTPYPHPATDSHLFSLYFLLPWIGVSCALLYHNWYPAKVFVGDTYCYFSGMVFAVVGILGHFSKTLGLLLVPQIFNFLYSCPQIFGLVPCPRHRLPKFNARTGLLEPSVTPWSPERQPRPLVGQILHLLSKLRLLQVTVDDKGLFVETSNFTILNLWLVWRGPLREDRLAWEVTLLQLFAGLFGLFVRHKLALLVFKEDNWGTTRH
ncbi:hypothetical protein Purlil1_6166 [Purpureocillium lilacinum]|uniref:UDP-N-acetylglucosamine--dolichyl-phosphate N-acetylglucosaminephosphotransferase n=1 Tax=Purpureocillium lilacinum TaxID=33203 RepID=A0ABR0BZU9_PURLI|nr:hypothetical protein Purlil1_6166 [Purpureocillium lilacinum]